MSKLEVKAYKSTAEGELLKEDNNGYRFKRIVICPIFTVESGKENTAKESYKRLIVFAWLHVHLIVQLILSLILKSENYNV
jgi:hypothetical protein